MSTKTSNTKAALVTSVKALITCINTDLSDVQSFILDTQTTTRTSLLALLQAVVDADAATVTAYGAWRADVAAEDAAIAQVTPVRKAMKTYLQARYGKSSPKLLLAGFAPDKPSTKTATSKMVGVVKGATTRALRNPLTKAEKKALKGTAAIQVVTGTEPKPVAAGTMPAGAEPAPALPPPAPAATAKPGSGSPTGG
jgi:hypothetical protein